MAYRLVEVDLSLSAPGFGRERTIFFIWSPDPSNFQQFCRENGDTPWAGQEHCSGALFPKLSYFWRQNSLSLSQAPQPEPSAQVNSGPESQMLKKRLKLLLLLLSSRLRRDEYTNSSAFIQEKAECF